MTQVRSRISSANVSHDNFHADLPDVLLKEETIAEDKRKKMSVEIEKDTTQTSNEDKNLESNTSYLSTDTSTAKIAFQLFVCFIAGIIFGFALEKGRVFEPSVIRDQFIYKRFIMMKMFLSAVASGQICMAILFILPFTKTKMIAAREEYFRTFQNKGVLSSLLGGFLLGSGMALCGACPGMVLAQAGAGVVTSYLTLLGCFVGVTVYAIFSSTIIEVTKPKKTCSTQGFDDIFHAHYSVLAMVFALLMISLVVVFEYYFPWETEINVPNQNGSSFITLRAWPPWVAGAMIGFLQVVIILVVNDTLGGSSGYCTIVAQSLITKKMQEACPYLTKMKTGIANWWQVVYLCGAIVGALLSSLSSGTLASIDGVSPWASVVGAFVMLFGARLAAGCTSGHGLSGLGVLAYLSMFAVAAMFAGGTIVGFALLGASDSNWSNGLSSYHHI